LFALEKNGQSPSSFLDNNNPHWEAINAAWAKITNHEVFTGICAENPLGLAESGITPFSSDDCRTVLATPLASYTCGFNAFWASPFFTTTPGVPINRAGVCSCLFGML
jgi:hypothetical protein